MLTAKSVMNEQVVTVAPSDTLRTTIELLAERHISGVPVVDETHRVVGIISEVALFDVLFDRSLLDAPVADFMTRRVETVREDDPLHVLAHLFALHGIRRLPVVRDDRLVGMVTRRDLLRTCLDQNASLPSVETQLAALVSSITDLDEEVDCRGSIPSDASM